MRCDEWDAMGCHVLICFDVMQCFVLIWCDAMFCFDLFFFRGMWSEYCGCVVLIGLDVIVVLVLCYII